jgi:ABC-2 type transport system ATP-binding protein
MSNIEVSHLTKSFKQKSTIVCAVNDISFNVKKGEILGFLGPNGAGKSTTINMLTGLVTQDSGSIKILGKDPQKSWEYVKNNTNVAAAYEKLTDVLTVKQNLKVYAGIYGVKNPEKKISQLAEMFRLNQFLNRRASKLSSGQHTRLVLAKSMINDPKVIFMDECTVGLDPDVAERTRQIIKDYNKDTGCSIVFTSHYMHEVEELCKRIVFMDEGRIIKIGSANDIKKSMSTQTIELDVTHNKNKLLDFFKKSDINPIQDGKNLIRFDIDNKKHNLQMILNLICKEQIAFKDIHIHKPTLEDFFIKLARKNEKEIIN